MKVESSAQYLIWWLSGRTGHSALMPTVSNSLVSRAQWSEWYHDHQWSVMAPETLMRFSWPHIVTPHPARPIISASEESEWLGDRWKVVFSAVYNAVCTQCVHQTWSMAGSLVPCVHTLANIPRNERPVSADTRCLQWPLRLVSTSADWHMLQGPLQWTGRGLLKSVYLLCDSHYWGLLRECEQAVLSNSMVLVLLNGVYFGLQTTKEWLKRVSDNSVKIIDVVLLKNDFGLNLT